MTQTVTWGSTLCAALFVGCFFAVLPGYFLQTVDGPAYFDCEPGPWRCEVQRWVGFHRYQIEAPVDRIWAETKVFHHRRGGRTFEYQVMFEHARNGIVPASGWVMTEPSEVVRVLNDARQREAPVTARLGSPMYTLMGGLTALFFGIGAALPLVNDLGRRGATPKAVRGQRRTRWRRRDRSIPRGMSSSRGDHESSSRSKTR